MLANTQPSLNKLVVNSGNVSREPDRPNLSTVNAELTSRYYRAYKEPYTSLKLLKLSENIRLSTD